MDTSPPNQSSPGISLSYPTPNAARKAVTPVTRGGHTITNLECSKKMIVTAEQLTSLTGQSKTTHVESNTCKIPKYGNKYPVQVRPPGHFHGILNEKDNLVGRLFHGAKVSGTVFNPVGSPDKSVKAGHESSAGFSTLWTERKDKTLEYNKTIADPNRHQFNGKQLCVYFSLPKMADTGTGEIGLKLLPSDYFSQAIARRGSPADSSNDISTVRAAYNCGSIMLVMTSDNKVVFGHRGGKPMFPAGFILGERSQQTDDSISPILAEIGETTTFEDLARDTALNERREEVYDDQGEWETEIKTFGAIGETLCWPSKQEDRSYQKPVFVIKSTVFMEHIPVSSAELNTLRNERPARDGHELGELNFLSENDFTSASSDNNFIVEHATCYQMLSEFLSRQG